MALPGSMRLACQTCLRSQTRSLQGILSHTQFLQGIHKPAVSAASSVCIGHAQWLHTSPRQHFLDARDKDHEKKNKQMVIRQSGVFDLVEAKKRNKKTYQTAVNKYLLRGDKYRRAHVEFIYAALDRMEEFSVSKDIDVYRQIINLFPGGGKMVARSVWQVEMMHYPKQQQCCIDILDQMSENGVVPDDAMGYQLIEIFGKRSHVFRKYQRMMYWMPKFKNMNPYPIPHTLPDDHTELARMALQRMAVDLENKLTVFRSSESPGMHDDAFIVSAQSPTQQQLLRDHPTDRPLYVEGGFTVWLRYKSLTYFILRSDITPAFQQSQKPEKQEDDSENWFNWKLFHEEKGSSLLKMPSVHEQADGTILALCITSTASKDSLISWINCLQESNPTLTHTPVVFLLRTPEAGIQVFDDKQEEMGVAPAI